jgi:hypothetical protein
MRANMHVGKEEFEARYPFYRSTVAERDALFGPAPPRRPASRLPEYERRVGA